MKKLITMGALALLGLPIGASAAPSAFSSKCGAIAIDNTTAATLMRDNEDCGLIWVLPPGSGITELAGYTPSGNLGMCKEVKDAQGTSARVMKRIDETSKALDDLKPEYEKANARLIAATAKVRDQEQIADVKLVLELQSELESLNARIDDLQKQIAACQFNCETLNDQYKQLSAERLQNNADVRKLRAQ